MPITLTTNANERSTYIVDVSFFDEAGVAAVPNAGLVWTLTDNRNVVVNSRSDVAITSAAVVTIVLTALDLAIGDPLFSTSRKILVKGTYNSTAWNNLPITEEITFSVNDFVALTGVT